MKDLSMKKNTFKLLALLLMALPFLGNVFGADKKTVSPNKSKTSGLQTPDHSKSDDKDEDDEDDDEDEGENTRAIADKNGSSNHAERSDEEESDVDELDSEESDPHEIAGTVLIGSDSMLRGFTQTDHQPVVQGEFDWSHPLGIYLGASASNVKFLDSPASIEMDGYGGYKYHFSKSLSASLGALYYWYVNDAKRSSWEVPAVAEYKSFKFEVDYSPRWEGQPAHSWYVNAGWKDEVIWKTTLGAFAGYSFFPANSLIRNYADYRVSVSHDFLGLEWELAGVFTPVQRIKTSESFYDPEGEVTTIYTAEEVYGGSRAVFSISKAL